MEQDQAESFHGVPSPAARFPAHPMASHQVCTPFPHTQSLPVLPDEVLREARGPCSASSPHPFSGLDSWAPITTVASVPELSHQDMTQAQRAREGHEKHSRIHHHLSPAPGHCKPLGIEVGNKRGEKETNKEGRNQSTCGALAKEFRATAQPRAASWAGAQGPGLAVPQGPASTEVLRAQGRGVDRPGPWTEEHKASWREGGAIEASGRDKGAFSSAAGNRRFSGGCPVLRAAAQPCGRARL